LAKAAGKETFELKFEPFEESNSEYILINHRKESFVKLRDFPLSLSSPTRVQPVNIRD